jgi:hypothetical protein
MAEKVDQASPANQQGSVTDWSDIIRRQGEESRRRDDEQLEGLKEQVKLKIQAVDSTEGTFLVQELRRYAGWGSHDPRQTVEMQKYVDAVEAELIKRLGEG